MEQMFAAPGSHLVRDFAAPHRYRQARERSRSRLALLAIVLAVAALVLLGGVITGGASSPPQHVVVHSGDTLWGIAEAHYPGGDIQSRVVQLEAANHLQSAAISPGEILTLPAA